MFSANENWIKILKTLTWAVTTLSVFLFRVWFAILYISWAKLNSLEQEEDVLKTESEYLDLNERHFMHWWWRNIASFGGQLILFNETVESEEKLLSKANKKYSKKLLDRDIFMFQSYNVGFYFYLNHLYRKRDVSRKEWGLSAHKIYLFLFIIEAYFLYIGNRLCKI